MGKVWWAVTIAMTALLGAACVQSAAELAAVSPSEYVRQFSDIDTGRAGAITLDQAVAHYTRRFAELDTERKGWLGATELAALVPVMKAQTGTDLLAQLDNNGDGRVTLQEFLILANWLFERARRGDGMLALADVQRPLDRPFSLEPEPGEGARMPSGGARRR
jgi:hypothetical protein